MLRSPFRTTPYTVPIRLAIVPGFFFFIINAGQGKGRSIPLPPPLQSPSISHHILSVFHFHYAKILLSIHLCLRRPSADLLPVGLPIPRSITCSCSRHTHSAQLQLFTAAIFSRHVSWISSYIMHHSSVRTFNFSRSQVLFVRFR